MPRKIFVSYRREDAAAEAARIRDRLTTVFGADNVFMDIDTLKPGQRFDQELEKALSTCDAFLAVIGPRWYDIAYARAQAGGHDYVREEIATALARNITVVPILIDRAVLPHPETLPNDLRPLVLHQAYQIRHEYFGRDADALITALAGKPTAKPLSPLPSSRGLLRVWVAVTLVWLAIVAAFVALEERPGPAGNFDTRLMSNPFGRHTPDGIKMEEEYQKAREAYDKSEERHRVIVLLFAGIIPPSVLFALGYLGIWCVRGFRPR
jgi:hypothetical protein